MLTNCCIVVLNNLLYKQTAMTQKGQGVTALELTTDSKDRQSYYESRFF